MDGNQFIDAIRTQVRDSAIKTTNRLIADPPGRTYPRMVEDRTQWVRTLDPEAQRHLQSVIAVSVHAAVFGFLCVLDGVRAIENPPDKGTLELFYRSSRGDTLLNDPEAEPLHDIYNEQPQR